MEPLCMSLWPPATEVIGLERFHGAEACEQRPEVRRHLTMTFLEFQSDLECLDSERVSNVHGFTTFLLDTELCKCPLF